MSSQPLPPSPIHPRATPPPNPSMTETSLHHQLVPFALPPPSYIGSPYNSTHRLPASVHLAPIHIPLREGRSAGPQTPHQSSPSFSRGQSLGAPTDDRQPAAPIEKLLTSQPYSPSSSDQSYFSHNKSGLSSLSEIGYRPSVQDVGRTAPVGELRRDYATYPSPSYSDYRGSEGPYRADALSSAPGPPHIREPSLAAQDLPTKERGCDRYAIQVRQQPLAARACGFGERDRRVIDPPPIVQLFIRDPKPVKEGESELRYPFNIVHCTLWNESGSLDETALTSQDRRVTRRLMGTLVSSPFFGLDENDEEGCFFCFPDLSCRTHGKYRLRFVLMRIDVNDISSGKMSPILTEAVSDVFTVFTAKDFPGMRASTSLTKALKRQGCAISVKKGNEKASAHPRDEDSGDEDADETGARTKKRRRG